jgi:CheY-like chemotaxis protein
MLKILLVDDEEQLRRMIKTLLERAGYTVLEACNGKEASQILQQWMPNLVLTDIVMPEKEGFELIRDLRRDHSDIRIIAMSGGARIGSQTYLKIASGLGADYVLAKPFLRQDLLSAIETVLGS